MFIPPAFEVDDPDTLFNFMRQHSFAMLASVLDDAPFVTHLPLLVDREAPPQGRLVGHFARANPQWRQCEGEVLAVFAGPHAYISPTWMQERNTVPTWNYTAVHAYGTMRLVEDAEALDGIVRRFVDHYEKSQPIPWSMDVVDESLIEKLLLAIVGFEIQITRLEGKWKLNQNHPEERRTKIATQLATQPDDDSQGIAKLMRETGRQA